MRYGRAGAVAHILGCSVREARRLLERGIWASAYRTRPGGHWRVELDEVRRWRESVRPRRRA